MTRPYAPALDGVRALCIILTVVEHIETLPLRTNGTIGVDIFFALSGWLITGLLLEEHRKSGTFDLRAFYIRRFFRIVPLYMLTVFSYVLAATAARAAGDMVLWNQTIPSVPYLIAFSPEMWWESRIPFGQAWTLGIEEKFYLVWPALFLVARGRAVIAIGVAIWLAFMFTAQWEFNQAFVRGYWGLGCGALLAVLVHQSARLDAMFESKAFALPAALAIGAIYMLSLWFAPRATGWNMAVAACGAILVASLWSNRAQGISHVLAFASLAWLGRLTYGIYLTHLLILNMFRQLGIASPWILLVATYVTSIAVAWGLHLTIERPLITWGRTLAVRHNRRAVLA